jgi:hypothetical protein
VLAIVAGWCRCFRRYVLVYVQIVSLYFGSLQEKGSFVQTTIVDPKGSQI